MFNRKTQRIIIIVIAVILAIVMIAALVLPAFAASDETAPVTFDFAGDANTDKILPGIYVGEIGVEGLTSKEAEDRVTSYVKARQDKRLTVAANGQTREIRIGDLGFVWANPEAMRKAQYLGKSGNIIERYKFYKDASVGKYTIPMTYSVVEDAVRSFAAQTAEQVNVPVAEPSLSMSEDGSFVVTDGHNGAALDQETSAGMIIDYLVNKWDGGEASLELPMITIEPTVSNEAMHSVNAVLGHGMTDFMGSSENRVQNIINGINKVNGTVLMPGEQFSLVEKLVPFDEENGYAAAPSYSSGTIVDSYGGGICQVSTTVYLAVLEAELQIDERHNHSMLVGYIKPSMDAAIAEGSKDLKFTNNTDAPIYIKAEVNGTQIRVDLYGHETRDPERHVEYVSEVLKETQATDLILFDDSIAFGHIHQSDFGHNGTESHLIKRVTVGGETTEEILNADEYQMSPITYIIGTSGVGAETLANLQAAAQSGLIADEIEAIGENGGIPKVIQTAAGESDTPDEDPTGGAAAPANEAAQPASGA